jgi:tRNA A-37 threonylcarbamoyl transferase component Bud32/ribosomal protein S27E
MEIETRCAEFERAWSAGENPNMEDLIADFAGSARANLLRELLLIELHYRRKREGISFSADKILLGHAGLMPELVEQLRYLRNVVADGSAAGATTRHPIATPADAATIAHTPTRSGSHALKIRCPHCSNPVELVADTPYETVTCSTCGSAFSLVDPHETTRYAATLQKVGRFELVGRLGLGGFGTVWKARDTELQRTVALKIPRKGQLDSREVEQFFREARSAAQLKHPNIVPVHEVGRDGETIYIVSDLIRGVALSDWLSVRPLAAREIAELAAIVADALHHAHEHGVIHRDLKPSNVLVDENGQPHLMDFGLAKRETGEITMTYDGQILGTPAYMSPEQARGHSQWTDRRTDIYSLGVVLFRMLTGELPFRGNAQLQIHQRLTLDAPDPRKLNRYIPRDMSTICLKCLERDPNRRYSSAQAVAEELRRYLRGEPILARPVSQVERAVRWTKRKPLMATTAALILFLAIAGPLAALTIDSQRRQLDQLVTEKNDVIASMAARQEASTAETDQLRRALRLQEGQADPWEIWPFREFVTPDQTMLEAAMSGPVVALADDLDNDALEGQQQLLGHLALAMMTDALHRVDDARRHYEAAIACLKSLHDEEPERIAYPIALADCYVQLARLHVSADRAAAKLLLDGACSIYQKLADKEAAPLLLAKHFEAELRSAMISGFELGDRHFERALQLKLDAGQTLPTSAEGLYEFACGVTGRRPLLQY